VISTSRWGPVWSKVPVARASCGTERIEVTLYDAWWPLSRRVMVSPTRMFCSRTKKPSPDLAEST
jgi:hypothetical protein